MEMSGQKAGIGSWLVWMLCHYAAYRMLLLLYLKACGGDELGTLDLGLDTIPGPQQLDQMEGKCNE